MRQVVRALLKNFDGKYLLVQHHKSNIWTTPGGHIESGESLHKALKREIMEEFHIKIKFLGEKDDFKLEYIKEHPLPIANYKIFYESKKSGEVKKWEYIFHCEAKDSQNLKVQEEEIKAYHWFSPEEIMHLENVFPQIPKLLEKVIS